MSDDGLGSATPPQQPEALLIRSCDRCGGVPAIVRTMLNSTTGKTMRMYECTCGERTWSEDRK